MAVLTVIATSCLQESTLMQIECKYVLANCSHVGVLLHKYAPDILIKLSGVWQMHLESL